MTAGVLRRATAPVVAAVAARGLDRPGAAAARVRWLLRRDGAYVHWAEEYADRLMSRHGPGHDVLIQSSMSPTGPFHIGNFRDTLTAYLLQRALLARGGKATILLSFDDYDPVRATAGRRNPDLKGYEGRVLADHPASQEHCDRYVDECRRAGVLGGGGAFVVHHQARRYRAGTYVAWQRRLARDRRRLARLLGTQVDRLFRAYCAQCGRNTTVLLSVGSRRVRYGCRHCGAVVTERDLRSLKPSWKLDWALRVTHEGIDCEPAGADHCGAGSTMERTQVVLPAYFGRSQPVIVPYALVRQEGERHRVSASSGGGLTVSDLLEVMPPLMLRWCYARVDCWRDLRVSLGLAWLTLAYREFDAFHRAAASGQARAARLWSLLSDERPRPQTLPTFRQVVHVVQSHLYCGRRAVAGLRQANPDAHESALAERVGHARAWLAGPGRSSCWLPLAPSPTTDEVPRVTARMEVADLLGEAFDPPEYEAFYHALYGCRRGPPLRRIVDLEGSAEVVSALRVFAATGERPLRERALSRLAGGVAG